MPSIPWPALRRPARPRPRSWPALLALPLLACLLLPAGAAEQPSPAPPVAGPVWVIELKDSINPGSALYLERALRQAAQAGAGLAVIQLDTPGGLADSMRQMVANILAAPLPVAVYVAPAGARAASAGAFLVLAAPLAAMAPATNLGAAHPVAAGGGELKGALADKAVEDLAALAQSLARQRGRPLELAQQMVSQSRSYEAGQALQDGLIDLMASDLASLLGQLEGVSVQTPAGPRVIKSQGLAIVWQEPTWREKLLSVLASPNLAYILLMIGLAGLYFELSTPGAILPGVLGGLCLLLALFAMSALPVSYAGLALIGLAVLLFVAEIKVASHGILSLGGAVALVLGSTMLFEGDGDLSGLSLLVLLPTAAAVIAFFAGVAFLAGRAQRRKGLTGQEGLIGQRGVMLGPGKARVLGEIWRVRGQEGLPSGQEVLVVRVEGLTLWVEPAPPTDS